jgi:hypothetical protein
MDDEIANVSSYDVADITVTDSDGKSLTLARPDGSGDLTVGDLGENEEMETSKANGLANVLSYLRFDDVADPALSDSDLGFDKPVLVALKTKKNKVFTLKLGSGPEGSEDRYARLSANYTPPPEPEKPAVSETEETGGEETGEEVDKDEGGKDEEAGKKAEEEAKKKKEEQDKLAKEVEEFNEKVGPWTYVVSSYKVDDVTTDRDYFVKEKEKPEEDKDEDSDDKGEDEKKAEK